MAKRTQQVVLHDGEWGVWGAGSWCASSLGTRAVLVRYVLDHLLVEELASQESFDATPVRASMRAADSRSSSHSHVHSVESRSFRNLCSAEVTRSGIASLRVPSLDAMSRNAMPRFVYSASSEIFDVPCRSSEGLKSGYQSDCSRSYIGNRRQNNRSGLVLFLPSFFTGACKHCVKDLYIRDLTTDEPMIEIRVNRPNN